MASIKYTLPGLVGRSSSPDQRRRCRRGPPDPPGRCTALIMRGGQYLQCKLCVREGTKCHHHRNKILPSFGAPRSILRPTPYNFTSRLRGSPTIATIDNGVRVAPSRALRHLEQNADVHLNGLYSEWHFAKSDMITLYDGRCWVGDKRRIPPEAKTHVIAGQGILYPILGLMTARPGRGGASFANSSRGLNVTPNCILYVKDPQSRGGITVPYEVDPRCESHSRTNTSFIEEGGRNFVLNGLVILVAKTSIAPGDELLFDYVCI